MNAPRQAGIKRKKDDQIRIKVVADISHNNCFHEYLYSQLSSSDPSRLTLSHLKGSSKKAKEKCEKTSVVTGI